MTKRTIFLLIFLFLVDAFLWTQIITTTDQSHASFYQLDVGQGDSTLLQLSEDVEILYDAGSQNKIASTLDKIMGPTNRRLEVVMISHPQRDHYGGLLSILEKFDVGLLVTNGRLPKEKDLLWKEILHTLEKRQVPHLVLGAGDKIIFGSSTLNILWPTSEWQLTGEVNESSLVVRADLEHGSVLLTGDIGVESEKELVAQHGKELKVDILKIPHHGSRFSASLELLEVTQPQVATIGVGKNNSHGHPHPDVLQKLRNKKISVWRTDLDGGVRIDILPEGLSLFESF